VLVLRCTTGAEGVLRKYLLEGYTIKSMCVYSSQGRERIILYTYIRAILRDIRA